MSIGNHQITLDASSINDSKKSAMQLSHQNALAVVKLVTPKADFLQQTPVLKQRLHLFDMLISFLLGVSSVAARRNTFRQ